MTSSLVFSRPCTFQSYFSDRDLLLATLANLLRVLRLITQTNSTTYNSMFIQYSGKCFMTSFGKTSLKYNFFYMFHLYYNTITHRLLTTINWPGEWCRPFRRKTCWAEHDVPRASSSKLVKHDASTAENIPCPSSSKYLKASAKWTKLQHANPCDPNFP